MRAVEAAFPTTVLVAVSGGSDSIALALLLAEAAREGDGLALHIAHLDHGIRGEQGRRDRDFVAALARRLELPFIEGRVRVPAEAHRRKLSLEHAARECRYAFLREAAERVGAAFVATGHTADDQAETVLLNLRRGAGISGLAGMPEERSMGRGSRARLIRPLLGSTRDELQDWLKRRGQRWRTDHTNLDVEHARNRVRHVLLPALKEVWPDVRDDLAGFTYTLRLLDNILKEESQKWLERHAAGEGCVGSAELSALAEPVRSFVIRELIARTLGDLRRIDEKHIAMIDGLLAVGETGSSIDLPRGLVVRRDYGVLRFALREAPFEVDVPPAEEARTPVAKPEAGREGPLAIPGETRWGNRLITTRILEGGTIVRELERIEKQPTGAVDDATLMSRFIEALRRRNIAGVEYLDYDRALEASLPIPAGEGREKAVGEASGRPAGLIVRSRRDGDRFTPLGAPGHTKLKDFFIRRKIPRAERDDVPLIVGRHVLAVVGEGIGDDVSLRPTTRRILRMEVALIEDITRLVGKFSS